MAAGCRKPELPRQRHLSRLRERSRSQPRERARHERGGDFPGNSSKTRQPTPLSRSLEPASPHGRGEPGNRTEAETRDIFSSPRLPALCNGLLQGCLFQAIQRRRFRVAERPNDFEDFAAGGEHPAAGPLVRVHRPHEFDFFAAVIPFAGGGVDLAPSVRVAPFTRPPLLRDRYVRLPAITARLTPSSHRTTFHLNFRVASKILNVHRMILRGFGDTANKFERG